MLHTAAPSFRRARTSWEKVTKGAVPATVGKVREAAEESALRSLTEWQEANGYPFIFFTEASLDLAEDEDLMKGMAEANILAVFVGIESPNEASLRETKKLQNVRGGTMIDRVRRIQDAGIEIWCGMIVGFDNDDQSIFDAQRRFITEARIVFLKCAVVAAELRLDCNGRGNLVGDNDQMKKRKKRLDTPEKRALLLNSITALF